MVTLTVLLHGRALLSCKRNSRGTNRPIRTLVYEKWILILVIIKDPFKQLRTITAILLAFNSAANLTISLVLLVDSVFLWSHRRLSPELVVYVNSCGINLYFIGNLLHTFNIYGMIVVPVRYSCIASKMRKKLIKFLGPIFIIITCIISYNSSVYVT